MLTQFLVPGVLEFTPLYKRVASSRLQIIDCIVVSVVCAYRPGSSEYSPSLESLESVLEGTATLLFY